MHKLSTHSTCTRPLSVSVSVSARLQRFSVGLSVSVEAIICMALMLVHVLVWSTLRYMCTMNASGNPSENLK